MIAIGLRGVLAVTFVAALAGCAPDISRIPGLSGLGGGQTDEEAVARVMNDVHRGMESRRVFKVLSHLSKDYYDAEGRDYAAMEEYVGDILRQYRDIRINRERPRVVVQGTQARVMETFGTRAEPMPGVSEVPVFLQGQVMVYLRKEGERWKIIEWGHKG